MVTFVPLAMFATPVFYRVTDLPDPLRVLAYANPLGTAIEMARAVVLDGVLPPTLAYCGFLLCHSLFAVAGMRYSSATRAS
jgi:lipopolysaccharide transport system permease protein